MNKRIVGLRVCFTALLLFAVSACDSDGDAQQLSNLVTVADAGYTSIVINGDTDTVIEAGDTATLSLQAFTEEGLLGTEISPALANWRSSDRSIAEVDARSGVVTTRRVDGEVDISVSFGNLQASTGVRVSTAPLDTIVIESPDDVSDLNECSAHQLVAMGIYQGEEDLPRNITDKLVWTVAQTNAAFDSDSSLLRTAEAGELSVTATRPESEGRPVVVGTDSYTVLDNLESIAIVADAGTLRVGSPLQYRAIPTYADLADETGEITDNVNWLVTDTAESGNFAQVDNTLPDKGLVTPRRAGDGELTVNCRGTGIGQSLIIVAAGSGRLASLVITPFNPDREFPLDVPYSGDEVPEQLVATALYTDQEGGLDVTQEATWTIEAGSDTPFSIGDDDDDKGLLLITGVGSVTVKATYEDENNDDAELSDTVTITSQ